MAFDTTSFGQADPNAFQAWLDNWHQSQIQGQAATQPTDPTIIPQQPDMAADNTTFAQNLMQQYQQIQAAKEANAPAVEAQQQQAEQQAQQPKKKGPWGFLGRIVGDVGGALKTGIDYVPGGKAVGLGNLVSSIVQAPYVLADLGANAVDNIGRAATGQKTNWTPEVNLGKGLVSGALGLVASGSAWMPGADEGIARWSREHLGQQFEAKPFWDRPEGLLPGLVSDIGMVAMGAGTAAKLLGVSGTAADAEAIATKAEAAAQEAEATAAQTGLPEHQAAADAARQAADEAAAHSARMQETWVQNLKKLEHPYQAIWDKGVQPFIDAAVEKGFAGDSWNPTTLAEKAVASAPDAVVSALQKMHDVANIVGLHSAVRGEERQVEAKRSEVLADPRMQPALDLARQITRETGGEVPYEQAQAIIGDQLMRRGEETAALESQLREAGVPQEHLDTIFHHNPDLALPPQFDTPEFHARLDEAAEGIRQLSKENTERIAAEPHLGGEGIDTRPPLEQTPKFTRQQSKMRAQAAKQFEQASRLEAKAPAEEAGVMQHIADLQDRVRQLPDTPEKAKILQAMAKSKFEEADRLLNKVAPRERDALTRQIAKLSSGLDKPVKSEGTQLLEKGAARKFAQAKMLREVKAEQERTEAYKQIAATEAMIREETRQARRARLQAKVANLHAVITAHQLPSEIASGKVMEEGVKMAKAASKRLASERAIQRGEVLAERERLIAQSRGLTPAEQIAEGLRSRAHTLLEDAQVSTQKDYERTVAKLQKEIADAHEQLRRGDVPSRQAAAAARTKGEKIIAALRDRIENPAIENVPPVWQPLYEAFQRLGEEAEKYPELEPLLSQFPKEWHDVMKYAEEHGFDPVHFSDMTTEEAKRVMFAHVTLGRSYQGLGSLIESTSRKDRERILARFSQHDRSLEALIAGIVKTTHEARTNKIVDIIHDQFARRAQPEWYDAARNRTVVPAGWTPWDPIKKALVVGDRLEGSGAKVVSGKIDHVIPTAVYDSLRRYAQPFNHPWANMLQKVTHPWKTYQLTYNPMFYAMHIVGHALLGALDAGVHPGQYIAAWKEFRNNFENLPEAAGASIVHEAQQMGRGPNGLPSILSPESLGAAKDVYGTTGAIRYALQKMRRAISTSDAIVRAYVMIHDLGDIPISEAHLPHNAAALEHAINRSREALVDMDDLSSIERNLVRAVIPFYSFHKGIAKLALRMPLDHPGMAALMIQMAKVHAANQQAQFSGQLPAAYTGIENILGTNVDLTRLNPFRDIEAFTNAQSFMANISPFITPLIDRGVGKVQGTWNVDPATGTMRFYPNPGAQLTIDRFGKLQPTPDLGQTFLSMLGSGTPGKLLTAITGANLGVPQSPLQGPPGLLASLLPIKTDQQVKALENRLPQAQFQQGLFNLSQAETDPITGKPIPGSPLEGLLSGIRSQQAQTAAETRKLSGQTTTPTKRRAGGPRTHRAGGSHKARVGGHRAGAKKLSTGVKRGGRAGQHAALQRAIGTRSATSKLGNVKGRTSAGKGFRLPSQRAAGGKTSVSAFGGKRGGSAFSGKAKGLRAFR